MLWVQNTVITLLNFNDLLKRNVIIFFILMMLMCCQDCIVHVLLVAFSSLRLSLPLFLHVQYMYLVQGNLCYPSLNHPEHFALVHVTLNVHFSK